MNTETDVDADIDRVRKLAVHILREVAVVSPPPYVAVFACVLAAYGTASEFFKNPKEMVLRAIEVVAKLDVPHE